MVGCMVDWGLMGGRDGCGLLLDSICVICLLVIIVLVVSVVVVSVVLF